MPTFTTAPDPIAAARRAATHRAEDLRRMADAAEREGCRILLDRRARQHVATGAGDPAACWLVWVSAGCTCPTYRLWHRCGHHALLLAELGLIPDTPALARPDPTVIRVDFGAKTEATEAA